MSQGLPPVAIVGGTFDPVHYGHLKPVREAAAILGLKNIYFVPASNPPHRPKPLSDAHHRLAMVKLALKDYPECKPDDRELQRAGNSYTIDTLKSYRHEYGKEVSIMMFIGADAFSELNTWYKWKQIPDFVHIIVLTRPGYPSTDLSDFGANENPSDKSSLSNNAPAWQECKKIDQLFHQSHGLVYFQSVTPVNISATEIRASLASSEQDNGSLLEALPAAVYNYIKVNNLYSSRIPETKCNHRN